MSSDMLDVGRHGRGTAYYAVNTVHIGVRAAGEGITTALICSRAPCVFSKWPLSATLACAPFGLPGSY